MYIFFPDWRWYDQKPATARLHREDVCHRKIIKWFGDNETENSPFSIHMLVTLGTATGKKIGDWYGPVSVSHLLRWGSLNQSCCIFGFVCSTLVCWYVRWHMLPLEVVIVVSDFDVCVWSLLETCSFTAVLVFLFMLYYLFFNFFLCTEMFIVNCEWWLSASYAFTFVQIGPRCKTVHVYSVVYRLQLAQIQSLFLDF